KEDRDLPTELRTHRSNRHESTKVQPDLRALARREARRLETTRQAALHEFCLPGLWPDSNKVELVWPTARPCLFDLGSRVESSAHRQSKFMCTGKLKRREFRTF